MAETSTIEWTDATWNPTRGCSELSPGCGRCYAKTFAERFRGVPGHPYEQGFDLRLVPEALPLPFTWGKPKKVFVNSMSDLFHKDVPDEFIVVVCRVMAAADWHTYQVLTKRSERMRDLLRGPLRFAAELQHVWWGVSVENQRHGLPRVDHLRTAPARVRFLSVEPLLEDLGEFDLGGIHWVIVGGESGRRPRPLHADWVRALRDRCGASGVAFFFKQWGGANKKRAGRELDGRTYDEMPAVTAVPVPARAERLRMAAEVTGRPGTVPLPLLGEA